MFCKSDSLTNQKQMQSHNLTKYPHSILKLMTRISTHTMMGIVFRMAILLKFTMIDRRFYLSRITQRSVFPGIVRVAPPL